MAELPFDLRREPPAPFGFRDADPLGSNLDCPVGMASTALSISSFWRIDPMRQRARTDRAPSATRAGTLSSRKLRHGPARFLTGR